MEKKIEELPLEIYNWLEAEKGDHSVKNRIYSGLINEEFDEIIQVEHNKYLLLCYVTIELEEPLQNIFVRLFNCNTSKYKYICDCLEYNVLQLDIRNGRYVASTILQVMEDGTVAKLTF
jgi:hypothetical protein